MIFNFIFFLYILRRVLRTLDVHDSIKFIVSHWKSRAWMRHCGTNVPPAFVILPSFLSSLFGPAFQISKPPPLSFLSVLFSQIYTHKTSARTTCCLLDLQSIQSLLPLGRALLWYSRIHMYIYSCICFDRYIKPEESWFIMLSSVSKFFSN